MNEHNVAAPSARPEAGERPDETRRSVDEVMPPLSFEDSSHDIVSELVAETTRAFGWWASQTWWNDGGRLLPERWVVSEVAPASIRAIDGERDLSSEVLAVAEFVEPVMLSAKNAPWLGDEKLLAAAGVRHLIVLDVPGVSALAVRLVFVTPTQHALTDEVRRSLTTAAMLLPKLIRQERASSELQYRSTHDALTGLLNRRGLEQACSSGGPTGADDLAAVIFLDLDKFKIVNDRHGHSVGDELLVHVASRLSSQIRPTDTLARLGGDEFVVVARGLLGPDGASAAAARLQAAINGEFRSASGVPIAAGGSLGVAFWHPGESLSEALGVADQLMYRAKRMGGAVVIEDLEEARAGRAEASRLGLDPATDIVDVAVQRITDLRTGERWGNVVAVEGMRINPSAHDIAESIIEHLGGLEGPNPAGSRIVFDFPGHFWDHFGLIADVLDRVTAALPFIAPSIMLDCSLASEQVRSAAAEMRDSRSVSIILSSFGSGAHELSLIESMRPVALSLSRETLASMGTLEPRIKTLRTTIAIGRTLGILTIATDLSLPTQAEQLLRLGCDLATYVRPIQKELIE